jgi:hypothetical protein
MTVQHHDNNLQIDNQSARTQPRYDTRNNPTSNQGGNPRNYPRKDPVYDEWKHGTKGLKSVTAKYRQHQ